MQFPAFNSPPQSDDHPTGVSTVVAIDKDKNSQQAVKWTVDHLLINSPRVTLIHVRTRIANTAGLSEQSPEAAREQLESEMQQLFLPYKGFCARKGVQPYLYLDCSRNLQMLMSQVVLEDVDVSKALIDYISANNIQNVVVGNSNRNAIMRKFKNPDVPSCLLKSAPEFCAVYVISKGKPITVRSAKSVVPNTAMPPRQAMIQTMPQQLSERRSFERFSDTGKMRDRPGSRSSPNNFYLDSLDASMRPSRLSVDYNDSFSEDSASRGRRSMDFPNSVEFSSSSIETPGDSSPTAGSYRDVEAEMKRLRLELKQTMDMYSNACKEAINIQKS